MSETQTRRYTHIVKRQSGYIAGWFHSREEAVAFEAECNFAVPGDPAHTEEIEGDEAWDGLVTSEDVARSPFIDSGSFPEALEA